MGYRLERNELVPQGLTRIAREQLASAADELGKRGSQRAAGIHEARKSIKKVRAVLRLVRRELGNTYRKKNARLRRVGRKLSEFRDATAIIQILDALKQKYPDELPPSIRRKLVARRAAAERQRNVAGVLQKMAATLRGAEVRVSSWPLEMDGFAAIAPGLESTYRAGRRALARAQKQPRPENYHELRKRVKDHWYHVRLIEDLWSDVMQGYEKSLKDLETWLGDDHNLVLLRETIHAAPDRYGTSKDVEALSDLIAKYQKELRDNSVSLGQRIYEEKPRLFIERMKHLWDTWQSEPKSLEKFEKRQKHPPAGKVAKRPRGTSGTDPYPPGV
jgi:CHAD domain-containing protein